MAPMDHTQVEQLLSDLKHPDAARRDRTAARFWHLWFHQKGVYGVQQLMQAQSLSEEGYPEQANRLLSDLLEHQPDFAEAWNRRAVLHYTQADLTLQDDKILIEYDGVECGVV